MGKGRQLEYRWKKPPGTWWSVGYLLALCIMSVLTHLLIDPVSISYNAQNTMGSTILQPPFSTVNGIFMWAGTDHLGRNVFHSLMLSLRTSLLMSIGGMMMILIIGTLLGLLSGYFNNKGLRIKSWTSFLALILFFFVAYWFVYLPLQMPVGDFLWPWLQPALIFIPLCIFFIWLSEKYTHSAVGFPLDHLILKTIEILSAFPFLLLILAFLSFFEPSLSTVMVLIIGLYWTEPARLVRGQVIKIRENNFVASGRALGFPHFRIMYKHILPEILPLLVIVFCTGVASLIMLEATLSYLGIGMPPESPSLGKIISSWRFNVEAWWLAVFPAILLCSIVLALKNVSTNIRQ